MLRRTSYTALHGSEYVWDKRLKSTRESGGLPEPLGPESLLHRLAGVLAHSAPRAECAKHVFELHKSNCGSQASGQTTLAAGAPPTQRMITGLVCGRSL